jgi:ribonucleoside-diphosphate reductase alpha chain
MLDEQEMSIYKRYSRERKHLQKEGLVPEWYTTAAWQMFKEKFWTEEYPDIKSTFERISKRAASFIPETHDRSYYERRFFEIMWNGWLAPSTPVFANMGTTRGCSVSCSGGVVGDDVGSFYQSQKEAALLSKNGFGTSGYLGEIRPRGSSITGGGVSSGVLPVLLDFVQMSRDISQGATRRGAWAGYLPIDHGDFWEVIEYIHNNPDDINVGWVVSDEFIKNLNGGDRESLKRYQRALKVKMITGKGYFFFVDKANRNRPEMYKNLGLEVKASNLCMTGDTMIKILGKNMGMYHCRLDVFVEELAALDEWQVWSFNIETFEGEWKKVTDWAMTNPNAKIVKITDEETGKSIRCTPDHQVFTKNRGYVMAKDLNENDELVIG